MKYTATIKCGLYGGEHEYKLSGTEQSIRAAFSHTKDQLINLRPGWNINLTTMFPSGLGSSSHMHNSEYAAFFKEYEPPDFMY